MEVTITDVPRCIKSFTFSPKAILSEKNTVDYLMRIKEYIFSSKCCEAAEKLGLNVFDLVFINDKAFEECCRMYLGKIRERDKNIVRTAYLLKKMFNREKVRIADVYCEGDKAFVKDPESAYLNILNDAYDQKKNKNSSEKDNKDDEKKLNKYAKTVLESLRLAAVKYGMKNCVSYKELIDKYNYRRFSSNLKLNNRKCPVEEIEKVLKERKDKCLADLSNPKMRINFSALYAITYGGFTLDDIYAKNTVFETMSFDKEKKLSDLAGDLVDIIYNGNGVEIANMFINIIKRFSDTELPEVNMKDLGSVMDRYTVYYATASLATVCENIFKNDGLNGELKAYLKKHTIENYWTCMDRLMMMKQYAVVVSFCYNLSTFDIESYREDASYQGDILYAFERATKFAKELKRFG